MKKCRNVPQYVFGEGSFKFLPEILAEQKKENGVIYLIDEFFTDKNLKLGSDEGRDQIIFVSIKNEPHSEYIDKLVNDVKEKFSGKLPSAVVGIGGGTTMDIAKCISILLTNPGKAENYQGWDLVKTPPVYKIGVPTISGTGSEVSRTAVMTSPNLKLGINSDYSVFNEIILDPDFLKTVPKDQFLYTAMDNYIHCVESLFHPNLNEMTKSLAKEAIQLLREAFFEKMDYGKVMISSYLGGMAVISANIGGHVCHPLSYGLSLVLGLHHGIATSLAFNCSEEYFPEEVKEFQEFFRKQGIELPKNVTKDCTNEQIQKMVEATLKNEKPLSCAFGENWRQIFTPKKAEEILRRI